MRFLKKLLVSIYIFLGSFAVACFIAWLILGDEPEALIAGVFAAAGIESVVGAIIKWREAETGGTKIDGGDTGADDTNVNNRRE